MRKLLIKVDNFESLRLRKFTMNFGSFEEKVVPKCQWLAKENFSRSKSTIDVMTLTEIWRLQVQALKFEILSKLKEFI